MRNQRRAAGIQHHTPPQTHGPRLPTAAVCLAKRPFSPPSPLLRPLLLPHPTGHPAFCAEQRAARPRHGLCHRRRARSRQHPAPRDRANRLVQLPSCCGLGRRSFAAPRSLETDAQRPGCLARGGSSTCCCPAQLQASTARQQSRPPPLPTGCCAVERLFITLVSPLLSSSFSPILCCTFPRQGWARTRLSTSATWSRRRSG